MGERDEGATISGSMGCFTSWFTEFHPLETGEFYYE